MNKQEVVDYMILQIEKLEQERLAGNLSIEPEQNKNDIVAKIKKLLEDVELTNEN